jgi:hypothetical protein
VVVHRRKERKHALRRRSGPSPEKAKKRDAFKNREQREH